MDECGTVENWSMRAAETKYRVRVLCYLQKKKLKSSYQLRSNSICRQTQTNYNTFLNLISVLVGYLLLIFCFICRRIYYANIGRYKARSECSRRLWNVLGQPNCRWGILITYIERFIFAENMLRARWKYWDIREKRKTNILMRTRPRAFPTDGFKLKEGLKMLLIYSWQYFAQLPTQLCSMDTLRGCERLFFDDFI